MNPFVTSVSDNNQQTPLARLSYAVRGSVNSILGVAELLRDTNLTTEQSEYLKVLRSSADRLLSITGDIVDLSAGPNATAPAAVITFDLAKLLYQTVDVLNRLACHAGIRISLTMDPAVEGSFTGDRQRVEEIFVTLLNNSIRAGQEGPITVVALSRAEEGILFRITVPSLAGSWGDATELALGVVERRVASLGGCFSADHDAAQSTFTIALPLARGVDPLEASRAEGGPARILVAEDSEENQFVLRRYLRNGPYQIDIVSSGRLALEHAQAVEYDVILMDLEMPEMDGMEATALIRKYESATGRTPATIIALTAHTGADEAALCLANGFTAYLSKPVNRATILSVVEQYARLRPCS
jgi:CheY-like chemotaxis protein